MKKVIGVTASRREPENGGQHLLNIKYTNILQKSGFAPIIIPVGTEIETILNIIDGVLFSGGADIFPGLYGENVRYSYEPDIERDEYEIELYEKIRETGKPVLGICRGLQMIFVAEGFALAQDLKVKTPSYLDHSQDIGRHFPSHYVDFGRDYYRRKVEKNGTSIYKRVKLVSVTGDDLVEIFDERSMTNSFHHQGVHIRDFLSQWDDTDKNIVVLALSDDNVIEAMKVTGRASKILTVQFHPEETQNEKLFKKVFA